MLESLKLKINNKKIKFYGWVNKNEIYKNSNIILITSQTNNFPYVALGRKSMVYQ